MIVEKQFRKGLRICGHRGQPEVRKALIKFARWLRQNYHFPIRVPAYLYPTEYIVTMHGERASASFFAPWDRTVEPFIRIATGDYLALKQASCRDDALASFIHSLAHEVIHYRQWVETGQIWERGVVQRARAILRKYSQTVAHP